MFLLFIHIPRRGILMYFVHMSDNVSSLCRNVFIVSLAKPHSTFFSSVFLTKTFFPVFGLSNPWFYVVQDKMIVSFHK